MLSQLNAQMEDYVELAGMLVVQHQAQEAAKDKKRKSIKPLNAFMAFRAYYQGLFPGVEQKERSGYLTFLWQQEKNQARWTILAKAFTIIRDIAALMGTEKPNLKEFLSINAPLVGLQIPPKNSSPEEAKRYLDTSRSNGTFLVEDVVANSLAGGFLQGFSSLYTDTQSSVAMPALPSDFSSHENDNRMAGADLDAAHTNAKGTRQIKQEYDDDFLLQNISQVQFDLGTFDTEMVFADNTGFEVPIANDESCFDLWCDEYFKYVNGIHMAELADDLVYRGGVSDEVEFSELSDVQTTFNPYAGDIWTTYNISAPVEDVLSSLLEC